MLHDEGVPALTAGSADGPSATAELAALRDALERLIASRAAMAAEVESLQNDLAARDERVRVLEGEVRDLLQTKRDVAKRVDDLIGQLDHFERDAELRESAAANV